MTSTSFNIGMSSDRSSSRVLKPPGGGHTNIFGEGEVKMPSPRPKYDQQNSTNLNFCMNTTDPNILVEQTKPEVVTTKPKDFEAKSNASNDNGFANGNDNSGQAKGGRVPPGGFSSGSFW